MCAKASIYGKDVASVQFRFYRGEEEIPRVKIQRYDLTSSDFKDYKFRTVIPRESNACRVVIYCRNGSKIEIRDLSITANEHVNPIDSGIRFIGHRALMQLAPENTMAGFELARRAGMWGVVINTAMTSDGVLVSLHDFDISRTSNGTGDIRNMTFAEARQYDFGSHFNEYYKDEKIPLLEDVVRFCALSGMHPIFRLAQDFTDDSKGALTGIYNLIKKYGLLQKCSVKAFGYESLEAMFEIAGHTIRYGWSNAILTQSHIDMMKVFQDERNQGAFLDVVYGQVTKEGVDLAIANDMPVATWIVDDFNDANRLIKMGVTEITTGSLTLQNCQF
jgi:glycerophosphoryl diester phosphodiesterase